jgi:hypothetical protein
MAIHGEKLTIKKYQDVIRKTPQNVKKQSRPFEAGCQMTATSWEGAFRLRDQPFRRSAYLGYPFQGNETDPYRSGGFPLLKILKMRLNFKKMRYRRTPRNASGDWRSPFI